MKYLLLFLLTVSSDGVFASETCQNKLDYDLITNAVAEKFYDRSFKGLKWPERVSIYREMIQCSSDTQGVATIINSLLAELKTSHTALYTKDDVEYWGLKSIFSGDLNQFKVPFAGIWPVKINGDIFAKFVLQGSKADSAGVQLGDKLIALNGSTFKTLGFNEKRRSVLQLSHDGGISSKVFVLPSSSSIQSSFLLASRSSEKIFRRNSRKIGYFHLWCGTHPEFLAALNQSLATFKSKKIDRLIIDLRDGFGGADPEYLQTLTTDPFYQKMPKIFLINEGVRSGKEWLAAIVKRDKLGLLVGTKTAGAFIAGGPVDLGTEKYLLYLAMKEFNPPDLPKLEGIGVTPDENVPDCRQLCSRKDPPLEWALHKLANSL